MLKVNDIFKFSILTKNNYMQDLATVVVLLASIDNSSMVTVIRKKFILIIMMVFSILKRIKQCVMPGFENRITTKRNPCALTVHHFVHLYLVISLYFVLSILFVYGKYTIQ